MHKHYLLIGSLAGLLCTTSSSEAVNLSSTGMGEVLLYPYYTVENGQDTYFAVVNTTPYVKAIKVRLLESINSQRVLEFNLYLSPRDHWAGTITRDPTGESGMLKTSDTSCTVPHITQTGIKFSRLAYMNMYPGPSDDGLHGIERTREGFIEVIEMGIVDDEVPGAFGAAAAAIHNTNDIPANCALLRSAWEENPPGSGNVVGVWEKPARNMVFDPDSNGGLYGYGVLINVAEGTNATYDAVALESFAGKILHTSPRNILPHLGSGLPESKILDKGKLISLTFRNGLDAVSSVLMQASLANDYVLEPAIAAGTDWVITLPTRHDYVNVNDYYAINPFLNKWHNGAACEVMPSWYWNRETNHPIKPVVEVGIPMPASPELPPKWRLCGAANVISFLKPGVDPDDENLEGYVSALYPSKRTQILFPVDYHNGWMMLDLASDLASPSPNKRYLDAIDGSEIYGLPVIGFAVQKYANSNLAGVNGSGAFYSGVINHKTSREIYLD